MIYVIKFVLTNYVDQRNPSYSLFDGYVQREIFKDAMLNTSIYLLI